MSSHRIAVSTAALFTLLSCDAAPRSASPDAAEGMVYHAELKAGQVVAAARDPAPVRISTDPTFPPQKPPLKPGKRYQKIHPRLLELLKKEKLTTIVEVVIPFKDTVKIPRFPELDPDSRRQDPRNAAARATAAGLVRELKAKRVETYKLHQEELIAQCGPEVEVVETFWLIDAVVAKVPLGCVPILVKPAAVLSIVPVVGEPPPQDRDFLNDVDDGRARIASDPYFVRRLTGGFIGLLDSGVRHTHRQFKEPVARNEPLPIDLRLDCVNGGADCIDTSRPDFSPDDDCINHGTSTAAILVGNEQAGAAFRGVTGATLDSFKVYPSIFSLPDNSGRRFCNTLGADIPAVIRGFQAAVAALDQVIVAELQENGGERGPISQAANAAFDTGAVVVAANGNKGPNPKSVKEPASASRVLGVGAFNVKTREQYDRQSRGPTKIDGRIKPDLQAPTDSETASNGCTPHDDCRGVRNDAAFRVFGETSGATPYAAGAAILMRNLLARAMKPKAVDPGLVYALMILSGQKPFEEPNFSNVTGAGPIWLPTTDGTLLWGTVSVDHGDIVKVPIRVHPRRPILDASLWWPENGTHNNIDLIIVDPDGKEPAKSRSVPSVFERARVKNAEKGEWSIRIRGESVPSGSQTVYFAILNQEEVR